MSGRPGRSAGLLLFRRTDHGPEVLLGHMGGPFFARREEGAWTVPKGEYESGEPSWEAARREFREELGLPPPDGEAVPLGVPASAVSPRRSTCTIRRSPRSRR
ncbi:NUDIX domain-containing protein, partial [Streptomyces sp. NPDC001215]